MAITAVTIEQDNKVDGADLMAVHSPLVFKALATHDGTAPDNLKASLVSNTQKCSIVLNDDGYLHTSIPGTLIESGFLYMAWVKTTELTRTMEIVSSLNSSVYTGACLRLVNGYPGVVIGSGSAYTNVTSSTSLVSGTWTHIAVSYSGANLRIFINGSVTETVVHTSTVSGGTATHRIGRRYDSALYNFEGNIDEVGIFSSNLDAADVQDIIANSLYGDATNIVGCYKLDQGMPGTPNNVETYYDQSGNGYHATNVRVVDDVDYGYYAGSSASVLASYYCIPVDDQSATQRRFALQAGNLLKSEMDTFDDIIAGTLHDPTLVSGRVKKLAIYFHDQANSYNTAPYAATDFSGAHAAREFGEGPCMSEQFDNTPDETVYGCIGFFTYVYMYNDTAASSVAFAKLTPTTTTPIIEYATAAGYYSAKVLVSSVTQTYGWYKNGELVKTITVKGVVNSCVDSKLLKFLDRDGLYRIYPFSKYYEKTSSVSQIGSVNKFITSLLTDQSDTYNIGYEGNRTLSLKQYVDYAELDFIESLYESPRVYLYIGDGTSNIVSDWVEVTVKGSGTVHRAKNLTGTEEITVTLPKHYTQTML